MSKTIPAEEFKAKWAAESEARHTLKLKKAQQAIDDAIINLKQLQAHPEETSCEKTWFERVELKDAFRIYEHMKAHFSKETLDNLNLHDHFYHYLNIIHLYHRAQVEPPAWLIQKHHTKNNC